MTTERTRLKLHKALTEKLPASSVDYCLDLWDKNPFDFKITRTRNTCLGNYKYDGKKHTITVNHDLNPFNFLITYIHEVAHLHVRAGQSRWRKKPLPHGNEWKNSFQQLMIPVLNEQVFPSDILKPLVSHMKNPKASSTRDVKLMAALRKYNTHQEDIITLHELPDGSTFEFKKRVFKRLEKRRTRALCLCLVTQQKYTLALIAEVKPQELA